MAHLYCLLFLLLSVVSATICTDIHCENEDLNLCFKKFKPNERTIRMILSPNIPYFLSHSHNIVNTLQSLTITSQNKTVVIIPQQTVVQLNILNISEVLLHNIEFRGSHSSHKVFSLFITINNSRSVNVTSCEFQSIIGLAMMITSTSNGYFGLDISHSLFNGTGNTSRPSQGVFVLLKQTGSASISVTHSNFSHFKIGHSPTISYEHRTKYRPLALEQTDNSHHSDSETAIRNFLVSDCRFENNQAFVGGGLGLYSSHGSNSNYTIQRCLFQKNTVTDNRQDFKHVQHDQIDVTGSGGGIAALLFNCKQCKLNMTDLILHGNTATLGGAIKIGFYFYSAEVWIQISNCSFTNNTADSGSGLYIESQLVRRSVPKPAQLSDLRFENNVATGFGSGIFVAYLPLRLDGEMYFFNNSNTSFAVISSQIEVYSNLTFRNNSGLRGGALFLSDNSQLLLDQHVSLYFEGNTAKDRGGAIYADSISLDLLYRNYGYTFYNVHCFIKHFIRFEAITPDKYTQNITFRDNSAPKGSAIYTHTLSPCSWYSDKHPYSNISLALRWDTYHYFPTPSKNDTSIIATAVAHYTISKEYKELNKFLGEYNKAVFHMHHLNITAKPGLKNDLYFVATDQLGLQEVSIATIQAVEGGKVKPCTPNGDESIFLTSTIVKDAKDENNTVELVFCGKPGDEGEVQFKSLDGLTIERWMHVTLADCPDKMFFNQTGNICSCYDLQENKGNPSYTQVLNSSTYSWADNGTFTQMSCPAGYCNLTSLRPHHKNTCARLSKSSECLDDRDGIRCSHCPGVLKSGSLRCVTHCSHVLSALSVLGILLGLFVIIAVLFLIRTSTYINEHVLLRAKLAPYARSFVFFCQFLFLLYFNADLGEENKKMYLTYQMIISKTGFFFNYDSCFTFGLTSSRGKVFEEYFIYLIGYIMIGLFAFFIFGVLSRCIKVYRKLSITFYVIVTYSYLMYAPVAFTTLRLLSCGILDQYNSTSGSLATKRHIWFYDAAQPCYGSNWDILMTSVAFLTLIFYILPLPLFYMLYAVTSKRVEMWKFVNKHIRGRKGIQIQNEYHAHHTQSKYKYFVVYFKGISKEYSSCFSESHFGFWIPITMIALLCLIVIQTNGAFFAMKTNSQIQSLAVVCFFFLYIRVSIKVTTDNYVQFYDSASIFLLCLACIFLIIDQNDSPYNKNQFRDLVTYFPCFCYVFLFLFILSPPAIRFCVKKFWPQDPQTEEKEQPDELLTTNQGSDEEVNDLNAPLLTQDPLREVEDMNPSPSQAPTEGKTNVISSYDSHHLRGSSSGPGVNLNSLDLTNSFKD